MLVISRTNWTTELPEAIRKAKRGEVIKVPTETMKKCGIRAAKRMKRNVKILYIPGEEDS